MTENTKVGNRVFFEKISVLLSDIENKVAALNDCSSDDFRLLNKYLKQQYNRIENISGNVTGVFEIINDKAGKHLLNQLTEFNEMYSANLKCTVQDISEKIDILEDIVSKHKLLYIPLKNLLQNFVTVNFLANSLKFNLSFRTGAQVNPVSEYIEKLSAAIESIKSYNKEFDDFAGELSDAFEEIASKTGVLIEQNSHNLESVNDYVLAAEKKIKEKLLEAKVKLPEIKRIKSQYSQSVNKIIINLQYSDIIRQKIDHITSAQRDMLDRINKIKEQETIEAFNPDLLKIKDVADLQTAQLIRTSNEYQNAIKVISEKFVDIRRDTNTLAFDILHFSGRKDLKEDKSYDFFYVIEIFRKVKRLVGSFMSENTGLKELYQKTFTIGEKFDSIFGHYKEQFDEAHNVVSDILKTADEYADEAKEVRDVLNQLQTIALSLNTNIQEISSYKAQIKESNYEINAGSNFSNCSDLSYAMDTLDELIESTIDYNVKIKHILLETETVEQMVSGDISEALKQVKYYAFYESTGREVIADMKELYTLITLKHQNIKEKTENLEEHQMHYTMQSERDVHDIVAGRKKEEDIQNNDEENEVEFF